MKASEAQKLAEKFSNIDSALDSIRLEALKGNTSTVLINLTDAQIRKLKELGYKISALRPPSPMNTRSNTYQVSWSGSRKIEAQLPPQPVAERNMAKPEALLILRDHNVWRRGDDDNIEMQEPKSLGKAIDVAVEALQELCRQELEAIGIRNGRIG